VLCLWSDQPEFMAFFMVFNLWICAGYMIMSRDQNAGRSHSMKIDNSSIERVEEFKYLGTKLKKKIIFRKKLRAD